MRRLPRAFYSRDALEVAKELIGCLFLFDGPEGRVGVRLVEVEAYRGSIDPGSHGYRGMTARTTVMFGPPGRLYVYFTYGMHWCANIVCGSPGRAAAVLLRAGEPVEGIEAIKAHRPAIRDDRLLTAGPARLTQAMGIDGRQNGESLLRGGVLWCAEDRLTEESREWIVATRRIGLTLGKGDDLPWRFMIRGHPYASRRG